MENLGFTSKTEKYLLRQESNKSVTPKHASKEESFLTYEIEGEKFRVFLKKQIRQMNESNDKQKFSKVLEQKKTRAIKKRYGRID